MYDPNLCVKFDGNDDLKLEPLNVRDENSMWVWNINGDFRVCMYHNLESCIINLNSLVAKANVVKVQGYYEYEISNLGGKKYEILN
jgi:hypothetical protein